VDGLDWTPNFGAINRAASLRIGRLISHPDVAYARPCMTSHFQPDEMWTLHHFSTFHGQDCGLKLQIGQPHIRRPARRSTTTRAAKTTASTLPAVQPCVWLNCQSEMGHRTLSYYGLSRRVQLCLS